MKQILKRSILMNRPPKAGSYSRPCKRSGESG
ncbi:tail assembly chaperone [Klebsiella phage vB_KpnS-VAC70]|uniref:Tail assembly chaperone n=3 Tax=Webervirus TaxID=1920860 RepID=A0AAE8YEA4_9CAUD|nr:tail assembly chaperone [Klebsiella phage vB_KpnS-VAC113]UEW68227.1 tail assembly chaperone [Klebsiella phage vB_KpnS-VAC70]UKL59198.1 tail assembly chaperone [Klebsiella phage vB_KpnS-VAC110]DAI97722.1 MAG TPA: hypothetical protein [Caudoviricetes sp.]